MTMVPETRLCEYCKGKIEKGKRADARFCSHACKLAARRKVERDTSKPTTPPPQPPTTNALQKWSPPAPEATPTPQRPWWELLAESPDDAPWRIRMGLAPPRSTPHSLVSGRAAEDYREEDTAPTKLVSPYEHVVHREHPTPEPLTLAELEETLLVNARKKARGYRLGIIMPSRQHGRVMYLFPSALHPSIRYDGREKLKPRFKLHPFEPPVIPMKGIYIVGYLDEYGRSIDGGHGVAKGLHLQPYGYVASLKDGDMRVLKPR